MDCVLIEIINEKTGINKSVMLSFTIIDDRAVLNASWRETPDESDFDILVGAIPDIAYELYGAEVEIMTVTRVGNHQEAEEATRRFFGGGVG